MGSEENRAESETLCCRMARGRSRVEQSDTGQTATDARSDYRVIWKQTEMMQLFEETIEVSSNWSVEQMIRLHSTLEQLAFRHRLSWDRTGLLEVCVM